MRKRLTLFLILPLYGIASLGVFTSYWMLFHRTSFQFRARQGNSQEYTKLTLTQEEFENLEWTERNREFRLRGKMYDISSIESFDGGYLVYCKHDAIESFVVDLFKYQKSSIPDKDSSSKNPKKFADKYYPQSGSFKVWFTRTTPDKNRFERTTGYASCSLEVESPPPEALA